MRPVNKAKPIVAVGAEEDEQLFWNRVAQHLNGRSLDVNQREAVTTGQDTVIVEAGPGSGKTTVLTLRLAYLLQVRRVPSSKVCVVTFTNAAATELRTRLSRLVGEIRLQASTIHSLAYSLLREAGWLSGRQIVPAGESLRVVRHFLEELGEDGDDDTAEQVMTEISGMRNRMLRVEAYKPQSLPVSAYRAIVRRYAEWKREAGRIDFDDLLVYLYMLLRREPARFVNRYSQLLVDEFQDTSLLQYDILKRLAAPEGRMYVVGDVDQSIYAWRGAGPEVMLQFPQDFPNCQRIVLTQNYRAAAPLVTCTNRLIQHNERRVPKVIEHVHGEGRDPILVFPNDDADEARCVADQLVQWHSQENIPWEEQAVLYRRNYQSLLFISELSTRGIPFRILGEPPNPFVRWVGTDVLAYLRLALGARDPELLVRIINRPSRYIKHAAARQAAQRWVRGVELSRAFRLEGATNSQLAAVEKLERRLEQIARSTPSEAIRFIRDEVGYRDYIDDYIDRYRAGSRVARAEAFAQLTLMEGLAQRFNTVEELLAFGLEMREMGRGWWRNATGAALEGGTASGVTLTTAHSAKGLEFDAVVVAGLAEGVLPGDGEDVEDERRLAYVAMTRARRYLFLSAPKKLLGEARELSRFVHEALPQTKGHGAKGPETDFSVGERVQHKTFGAGRIVDWDGEGQMITVWFDNGTTRRLSLPICQELGLLTKPAG